MHSLADWKNSTGGGMRVPLENSENATGSAATSPSITASVCARQTQSQTESTKWKWCYDSGLDREKAKELEREKANQAMKQT